MDGKEEYRCRVCGRKISKEEYEAFDGLCEECWEDERTKNSFQYEIKMTNIQKNTINHTLS